MITVTVSLFSGMRRYVHVDGHPRGNQRSYKIQIPISRANFGAKTGEADCKCLECGQRLPIVHRENIILDLSTLKYHSFIILNAPWLPGARWSNKLEVLHRGNHNPTMKIQTPALQILMPTWCFIVQNQGTVQSCFASC